VGLGYWLALLPVILNRLFLHGPLPPQLTPTLAILIAPPASVAGYGVMSTPALVVDEQVVLAGRVPTAGQLRDLLAPLAS